MVSKSDKPPASKGVAVRGPLTADKIKAMQMVIDALPVEEAGLRGRHALDGSKVVASAAHDEAHARIDAAVPARAEHATIEQERVKVRGDGDGAVVVERLVALPEGPGPAAPTLRDGDREPASARPASAASASAASASAASASRPGLPPLAEEPALPKSIGGGTAQLPVPAEVRARAAEASALAPTDAALGPRLAHKSATGTLRGTGVPAEVAASPLTKTKGAKPASPAEPVGRAAQAKVEAAGAEPLTVAGEPARRLPVGDPTAATMVGPASPAALEEELEQGLRQVSLRMHLADAELSLPEGAEPTRAIIERSYAASQHQAAARKAEGPPKKRAEPAPAPPPESALDLPEERPALEAGPTEPPVAEPAAEATDVMQAAAPAPAMAQAPAPIAPLASAEPLEAPPPSEPRAGAPGSSAVPLAPRRGARRLVLGAVALLGAVVLGYLLWGRARPVGEAASEPSGPAALAEPPGATEEARSAQPPGPEDTAEVTTAAVSAEPPATTGLTAEPPPIAPRTAEPPPRTVSAAPPPGSVPPPATSPTPPPSSGDIYTPLYPGQTRNK